MKKCPFCQEEIQDTAVKCRYCGEWIEKKEEPTGSPQQSTVAIPAIEKNKRRSGIIFSSWKTSILTLVIAAFGLAFLAPSGTKVSPMEVFWTWMWLQLTFDGWKYLKWKTLIPFPIVMFILSFILIITGGRSQSPNFWYIGSAAILNIGGLILFYLYLKKSQKEIIGETTTSNIIKQEKEDSSGKYFYHAEQVDARPVEKARSGISEWFMPILFIGIVFVVIAIVATYFYYKDEVGLNETAVTEAPEPPKMLADDWFHKAASLCVGGKCTDPQKVIEYLNNAIKLKPDMAVAYSNRGVADDNLGQYQRAIEDYNEAIRLQPDLAEAYGGRGNACAHIGKYQLAIKDLSKAISLKPDDAISYYNRGLVYRDLRQHKRVIDDFNQAIRLKPDFTVAYYARGMTYSILDQYQRAIEDFNQAIYLKPDDPEVYIARGQTYLLQDKINMGCLDAQKACNLGNCKLLEKHCR